MNDLPELPATQLITDLATASALLDPLRLRILTQAREALSASEIAERLQMSRQKVNYHVKALSEQGLLLLVDERRKRNMIERVYRASAQSYLLAPDLLGPLAALAEHPALDETGAYDPATLMALAGRLVAEVSQALAQAEPDGRPLTTLSITADFRFLSYAQQAAFTYALREALDQVVRHFAAPYEIPGERPAMGRPFRLLLGCYPLPGEDAGDSEK
jgi:DNA-binding transcriptional ArsR family regulator